MASRKKLSDKSKLALARAQKARLEKELAKVAAKVEACIACDARKLESELERLSARQTAERKALAKKLNLKDGDIAPVKLESKTAKRKALPKKASKKRTSKRRKAVAPAAPAAPKKTAKKRSSKKTASKKTSSKKRKGSKRKK
jgi:hypothetical protein